MFSRIGGDGEAWPETLTVTVDRLLDDPEAGRSIVAAAASQSQRLELSGPLRLGMDPSRDLAVLRFLSEATTQLVEVHWTLAGEPPWPVRTAVHLPPPRGGVDPAAREYTDRWREHHRYGLCTYRRGPGFVSIRDIRPDGPLQRILIDGPWVEVFESLTAGVVTGSGSQLLDELAEVGLTADVGGNRHLLPVRLRRWPIPYNSV